MLIELVFKKPLSGSKDGLLVSDSDVVIPRAVVSSVPSMETVLLYAGDFSVGSGRDDLHIKIEWHNKERIPQVLHRIELPVHVLQERGLSFVDIGRTTEYHVRS